MNYEVKHPLVALTRCFFDWLPRTKCISCIVPAPIGQAGAEVSQPSPSMSPLRYINSLSGVNFYSGEGESVPHFPAYAQSRLSDFLHFQGKFNGKFLIRSIAWVMKAQNRGMQHQAGCAPSRGHRASSR